MADAQTVIEGEVLATLDMQRELSDLEQTLADNPNFQRFLELSKTVPKKIEESWKKIELQMIDKNIKKVSGDWGSLTIVERTGWEIDADELPPRFFKKVPDLKKITDKYKLEGEGGVPKGVTLKPSQYLMKRIK